jgi:hypothetical protein
MKKKRIAWVQLMDSYICGVWLDRKPTKAQRVKAYNDIIATKRTASEVMWNTALEKTWVQ